MDPIFVVIFLLLGSAVFVVPLLWILIQLSSMVADFMCLAREIVGLLIGVRRK